MKRRAEEVAVMLDLEGQAPHVRREAGELSGARNGKRKEEKQTNKCCRYEAEGRKEKVEKETNTVEQEGSELDSLAGVSSLKEDFVKDPDVDAHSSEMLIDMGRGFRDHPRDNRLDNPQLKKDSAFQSQNADNDSRSGLCWWEQSIHSDTPTKKIMDVCIQNSCKPAAQNSQEKDSFEESVNNFQPSTADLATLASPVLPTSSLHSSSLSSIFSLTQVISYNCVVLVPTILQTINCPQRIGATLDPKPAPCFLMVTASTSYFWAQTFGKDQLALLLTNKVSV